MTITEIQKNIFEMPANYYFAHGISADYKLGAGVAKIFNEKYDMRHKLESFYPNENCKDGIGCALLVDNVFNLVTKEKCYHKPNYTAIEQTLKDMKNQMIQIFATNLAMPKIGCGLDKLEWSNVKEIIEEVFGDTDINITICYLD